jgi:alpha-D-ribose 1-methylphosphonate 5-triphosphate synthase subunit PhnL
MTTTNLHIDDEFVEYMSEPTSPLQLSVCALSKSFTLHNQDKQRREVVRSASFSVTKGETVALVGPSGAGKSTILRCLYGNYLPDSGSIHVAHRGDIVDVARADAHTIQRVRRYSMGWVSQFLRVIPRIPTIDVVAEPALRIGLEPDVAIGRAEELLSRLNVPTRLWHLVNLARGLVAQHQLLLVDEPTASLDEANKGIVVDLLREASARGTAIVGIFHDEHVRTSLNVRSIEVHPIERQTHDE